MICLTTHSEEETEQIAATVFAPRLHGGDVLALYGALGSGKTAFVRGLARGLGIRDRVSSPTFALVHRYRGDRAAGIPYLSHYDFDRLQQEDELEDSGYFMAMEQGDILVSEWSERIEARLPAKTIRIHLRMAADAGVVRFLEIDDPAGRFDDLSE